MMSFIVVSYNRAEALMACLDSIRRHAAAPKEILVEVNGTDAVAWRFLLRWQRRYGKQVPITVARNDSNLGWVRSINRASARAGGDRLMLLNDDFILGPRTLPAVQRRFEEGASIVGLWGFRFNECGWPVAHDRPDWVEGCGLTVGKELFATAGGFDESFGFGYFEDCDFCFRAVREHGARISTAADHDSRHLCLHDARHALSWSQKNRELIKERWPEAFGAPDSFGVTA